MSFTSHYIEFVRSYIEQASGSVVCRFDSSVVLNAYEAWIGAFAGLLCFTLDTLGVIVST